MCYCSAKVSLSNRSVSSRLTTLDHSGRKQMTRDKAAEILAELKTELSPDVVEGAIACGQERSLSEVVEKAIQNSVTQSERLAA